MQWNLVCIGQRMVHVGPVLDEELAQLPMPMKRRPVEVAIVPERLEGLAVGEQESHRTHVAVVRAPFD